MIRRVVYDSDLVVEEITPLVRDRELCRVRRPQLGRVCDRAVLRPLPEELMADVESTNLINLNYPSYLE